MSNAELFSTVARAYANFRPGYPPELFEWLARVSPARDAVWDCGCGSGQASVPLAEHFAVVHATDVAPEQIAAAKAASARALFGRSCRTQRSRTRISGPGDRRPGTALVRRDGVLRGSRTRRAPWRAAGGAGTIRGRNSWTRSSTGASSSSIRRWLGPYWPPERRHVEDGYKTLPFPFEEVETPEFGFELNWNLEQLAGYASSWSATARYRQALGTDPVPLLRESLEPAWPAAGRQRSDPHAHRPARRAPAAGS